GRDRHAVVDGHRDLDQPAFGLYRVDLADRHAQYPDRVTRVHADGFGEVRGDLLAGTARREHEPGRDERDDGGHRGDRDDPGPLGRGGQPVAEMSQHQPPPPGFGGMQPVAGTTAGGEYDFGIRPHR